MSTISVIIPAYNEEQIIHKTAETITALLENKNIDYEIIFVNDGSRDGTWSAIHKECMENTKIKGLCFARNFGKEAAMFAGLEKATGDCAVIIDCDLQHPPEKIIEMFSLWQQGYELVEGKKSDRGNESGVHGFFANLFYSIISKITKIDLSNASDFKLMDRKVIDALKNMPERKIFFRAMSSWVGFKSTSVSFEVRDRQYGQSKWSKWSLFKYAVSNITSFSTAPMQIVSLLGLILFIFSIVLGIQTLVLKFSGRALEGFATVIIIQLFVGSVLMMGIGVLGYYIARIYEEVKRRPKYILTETLNVDETDKTTQMF